jgi:archaellum component FlaC
MKRTLALLLTLLTTSAFAQVPDTLFIKYDSLAKLQTAPLDSASNRLNSKIDATQQRLNNILNPDLDKLTSRIRTPKVAEPDSLRAMRELDSLKSGLTHKIDSLKGLNLPNGKYTRKLDSLNQIGSGKYLQLVQQRKQHVQEKITKPVDEVTQKINRPLDQVEQKINKPVDNIEAKVNEKLNVMRQEGGEGANLPGNVSLDKASISNPDLTTTIPGTGDLKVPATNMSNPLGEATNPLSKIDNPISNQAGQAGNLTDKANDITSVPQQQIDKVKSIEEIQGAKEKVGELNSAADKAQAYGNDVTKIAQGDLGEVKQIPEAIEGKATSLDEIKELEKQTGELNKAKGMIDKGKDPEALKEMAKQEVVKQATDHFAGQQAVLQAAMEKVSKLKSKYSEVKSLADLPKRAPNPMKGKPLIERIIPGVTLQIQKSSNFMIDVNPLVSYRFTGRVIAGLGWNERLSFAKWNKLDPAERIYGPRVFSSFSFQKGFSLKAEVEKMNTVIPPFALSADAGTRQWIWSAFIGMKKDYTFIGKVKGNVQVLYNLYDDHDNSPYGDRLHVRMGFEFPMKKKFEAPKN